MATLTKIREIQPALYELVGSVVTVRLCGGTFSGILQQNCFDYQLRPVGYGGYIRIVFDYLDVMRIHDGDVTTIELTDRDRPEGRNYSAQSFNVGYCQ